MENFVVAVFADYDRARMAAEDLERAGFSPADVQLSPEAGNASSGQAGAGTALAGDDDATPRSLCVLSVEAGSDTRRTQALEIVRRHEPLDVDERVSHWTAEGWRGDQEPPPGSMARRAAGEGAAPGTRGRHR